MWECEKTKANIIIIHLKSEASSSSFVMHTLMKTLEMHVRRGVQLIFLITYVYDYCIHLIIFTLGKKILFLTFK